MVSGGVGSKEKTVKPLGWIWFTGIMLGIAACLPYVVEFMCSKAYATHRHGVVLVTDATSPVGKATCLALMEDGYAVYGGVRSASDERVVTELGSRKLLPVVLDMQNPGTVGAAVAKVKSELQGRPFTALVNTIDAGGAISPIESQDLSSLKRLFDINTFGTLAVVQAFLPLIREHGSRLVLMSSLCAHLTSPLFGGLCASKAALESLADALRRELAHYRISVSSIEPAVAFPEMPEGGKDIGAKSAAAVDLDSKVYAHLFAEDKARALVSPSANGGEGRRSATAAVAEAVAQVVIHAVSSTHPKLRYPAGYIGHLPASVAAFISWGLPGRMQDLLLA
ncbi:hypothetical protein NSK_002098 [Nannochloropsis salina CCMP1776]|uniref:Ketoreductase domain-containing protein n=1 Tax=Nannochloropsis salina CCMP1776 TaxID=1027361 RepID=A0A4D9D3Y2_9STRA|nr:hypothetical protein NSK_002098 [Nannochloropsis salina CCMP1776]|eukprot:TFJ86441.1 hypothetical protein NSK_002098 [Nannochloropsis salina CCMP1776]